ncbi:unnamed protein product [Fraxinus pennsylvanica]|uniref:Uncharacterized protein n=1 Tax=Fraxinus pennsylvanica TaxID=56036 RepID=A0AAD2A505_9LAMI|nr:unnamed protein product [Fraxinus pennsylvanica]
MAACNFIPLFPSPCPNFRTNIAEIGKINFFSHVACKAPCMKWSIDKNLIATTNLSTQHAYLNGHSFRDEFDIVHKQKLENIKQLLLESKEEDPIESLNLVNAIQRLAIDNHFHEEIDTILRGHYFATSTCVYGFSTLRDVSLLFRLLRQEGYHVPADVFHNFKSKDGKFKGHLRQDVRGLMELYEASQLNLQGEDTLDEAANFSSEILSERLTDLDSEIISHTLMYPHHKSVARLTANFYFKNCSEGINGCEKPLKELASLDFFMVQRIYQQELLQISMWWEALGLAKELKLARNQLTKWYIWSIAAMADPSLSEERIDLTKSIAFIYFVDDIFDLYGKPHELTLFTEAINRWEHGAIENLPEYMKICCKALIDTTNEIGYKIYKKHGYNPIDSLKKMWASLCNAFLVESKWFASHELPKADEYLENGKVSSGVPVVLVLSFFLTNVVGSTGSSVHLEDISDLIASVSTILRIWDDLGSAKDEQQDGKDGSFIESYVKEHRGLSIVQAREHVNRLISSEWKRLNKESFRLNQLSASSITKASLNIARMVPLMYSYSDNQRLLILGEHVKSTLFDEIYLDCHLWN